MKSTTRGILAVVLVAASGPAGFFVYRGLLSEHLIQRPQPRATAAVARSTATRTAPPKRVSHTSSALHIPDRLPHIALPDRSGAMRTLSAWHGRPLMVNFWATWCAPCRHEIPLLEKLARREAPDHLQIVGIAVDQRAAALKYARALHINYPILAGGEARGLAAVSAFGMEDALPFTVFADARGRIVTVKLGALHSDELHLILARVRDVDHGRLTLSSARRQIAAGLQALGVQRAKKAGGASIPPGA